jgi:protein arginine N-methyltransferase 1
MGNEAVATPGYAPEQIWLPASEQLMEWDMNFHELLLGDKLRMTAFSQAIAEVIQPGSVVVDLGTGTGILAEWALHAGARRVYAIELNRLLLALATARIESAGFADRFCPVLGLSFDVELPEPVDVIVSETMGNIADNEGFVKILKDARRRFLKPGGVLLPRRVSSYLVPVSAERAHAAVRQASPHGVPGPEQFARQLRARMARNPFDLYYDAIIPTSCYLSQPRLARRYEFSQDEVDSYELHLSFIVHRSGSLTGFKGYFVAILSNQVILNISGDDIPGGTTSDSWKHCFLPIEDVCPVHPGDRIELTFRRSRPIGAITVFRQCYQWRGEVISGNTTVACFEQEATSAP